MKLRGEKENINITLTMIIDYRRYYHFKILDFIYKSI